LQLFAWDLPYTHCQDEKLTVEHLLGDWQRPGSAHTATGLKAKIIGRTNAVIIAFALSPRPFVEPSHP
jgi:hypothetical protein